MPEDFVTGAPQRLIEAKLRARREKGDGKLLGESCMALGKELGKAMLTVLGCLPNGTLVSGLDNGRLQLWRHGARFREVLHDAPMGQPGAVACLAVLDDAQSQSHHGFAFVTGGSGSVKFWTEDGECARTLMAPVGTTPYQLVATGPNSIAAVFDQARAFDPNAFRLVPQNDEQRRRRAEAEAAQAAQQAAYNRTARNIHVFHFGAAGVAGGGRPGVQAAVLAPWEEGGTHMAPPVTALAVMATSAHAEGGTLVAGDAGGRLRVWKASGGASSGGSGGSDGRGVAQENVALTGHGLLSLCNAAATAAGSGLAIVDLAPLAAHPGTLAVSTSLGIGTARPPVGPGMAVLTVPDWETGSGSGNGVCVVLVDVPHRTLLAVLAGHSDVVRHLCPLPNGDLVSKTLIISPPPPPPTLLLQNGAKNHDLRCVLRPSTEGCRHTSRIQNVTNSTPFLCVVDLSLN